MSLEQRGVFYFESTDEYPKELIEAFQYSTWADQSPEFKAELSPDLIRKFKQLSLISMAINSKLLKYSDVCSQLDISEDVVELFLVESLLDKAIEGKVNARDQTLYIYSCATRNCDTQQVEEASELLDSFMKRLEATIHSNMGRLKSEVHQGTKRSLEEC